MAERRHTTGLRNEAGRRGSRVDPDHPVSTGCKRSHLGPQDRGVVAFPAVGDDDDNRPVRHTAPAVLVHEEPLLGHQI